MRSPQEKHAELYIKNGWSILPVREGTKEPLLPWKSFTEQKSSFSTAKTWFEKWPNCGIGIVTGQISNLSVVDCDSFVAYNNLKIKGINSNVIVKTPKGYHMYFKYNVQAKTSVRVWPDVDLRSESGFVVSPPTNGYRFNNAFFNVRSIPEFPNNLLPKKEESTVKNGKGWLADALSNLREGNRDDTFTKIIGRLYYDGHTSDSINLLLAPYAESSGFGLSSLNEKINHILSTYSNHKPSTNSGISLSAKEFLSQEEKIEWVVPQIFAKQTLCFIVGLPEALKTWAAMDLAIEIARNGKWLGHIKTNKAKVLFIDQERAKPETQRRFKALLAEKALTSETISDTLYIDCSSHRKMDLDSSYQSFKHELQELKPDVVIVDSFVTFHTKSENDRMEIQKVLDRLKLLREEIGCAFIFINHESKMAYQDAQENQAPSAGRMVGSIGVVAAADSIVSIKKVNANTSALHHTKNSLANQIDSFMFSISDTDKGIKLEAQSN